MAYGDELDAFLQRYTRQKLRDEATRQGVSPDEVDRLAGVESSYDPKVITGGRLSSKGAIGTMQLMPGTASDLGVDPYNLEDNIRGGVAYYKQQRDKFGNPREAAAAYNAGPGAVQKYGGVPPYKETQDYVQKVASSAPAQPAAQQQQMGEEEEFLERYERGAAGEAAQPSPSSPSSAELAPIDKPANRSWKPKPLSATEQRNKRAAQIIREIESRRDRAVQLFQQADKTNPNVSATQTGQRFSEQEILRARAEAELDTANRLAEDAKKSYGDLIEIGFGQDANPQTNRRWAYAKAKRAPGTIYVDPETGRPTQNYDQKGRPVGEERQTMIPNIGVQMYLNETPEERAAGASREEIEANIAQQNRIQGERNRLAKRSAIGRAWEGVQAGVKDTLFGDRYEVRPEDRARAAENRAATGRSFQGDTGTPTGAREALGQLARAAGSIIAGIPRGAAEFGDLVPGFTVGMSREERDKDSLAKAVKPYTDPLERAVKAATPIDPNDESWVTAKIPAGIGSALGFMAGGALGRLAGISEASVASGLVGGAAEIASAAEEMDAAGIDPKRRDAAIALAGVNGLTEMFGLGGFLDKFGLKRQFMQRAVDILEEGGQEALQQYLGNINAVLVGQYDKNRSLNPLSRDVLEAAVLGGIVGGFFQGADLAAGAAGKLKAVITKKQENGRATIKADDLLQGPNGAQSGAAPAQPVTAPLAPTPGAPATPEGFAPEQPNLSPAPAGEVAPAPAPVSPAAPVAPATPATPAQPAAEPGSVAEVIQKIMAMRPPQLTPEQKQQQKEEKRNQERADKEAATEAERSQRYENFRIQAEDSAAKAQTLIGDGDYTSAIAEMGVQRDALQQSIANLPKTPQAVQTRAELQRQMGTLDAQIKEYRRQEAEARKTGVRPGAANVTEDLTDGAGARSTGRLPGVEETFRANYNDAKNQASLFEDEGRFEDAVRELDAAFDNLKRLRNLPKYRTPKTAEDADKRDLLIREISLVAGERGRLMTRYKAEQARLRKTPKSLDQIRSEPRSASSDVIPTRPLSKEETGGKNLTPLSETGPQPGPLLRSIVNPEGGNPESYQDPNQLYLPPNRGKKGNTGEKYDNVRLISRIKQLGGINPGGVYTGDLQGAIDKRLPGMINRKDGYGPDDMLGMLADEGYNVDREDLNSLFDAIDRDIRNANEFPLTRSRTGEFEAGMSDYYENLPDDEQLVEEAQTPTERDLAEPEPRQATSRRLIPPKGTTGNLRTGSVAEPAIAEASTDRLLDEAAPQPAGRTIREQLDDFRDEMDPEDLEALERALANVDREDPREYADRTRPGNVGSGLSYSPYAVIVANNKEQVKALYDTPLNSEEGQGLVDTIREYAVRNDIPLRHVHNMLNYIRGWQMQRARLEDQGIDPDEFWALQWDELQESTDYLEQEEAKASAKLPEIARRQLGTAELGRLFEAGQDLDSLLYALHDDSELMESFERAVAGDEEHYAAYEDGAVNGYGISIDTARYLVESRRAAERIIKERNRGKEGGGGRASNAPAPAAGPRGDRRTGRTTPISPEARLGPKEYALLNTDPASLSDAEFDEVLGAIDEINRKGAKGPFAGGFELKPGQDKWIVRVIMAFREERHDRVMAGRLPALDPKPWIPTVAQRQARRVYAESIKDRPADERARLMREFKAKQMEDVGGRPARQLTKAELSAALAGTLDVNEAQMSDTPLLPEWRMRQITAEEYAGMKALGWTKADADSFGPALVERTLAEGRRKPKELKGRKGAPELEGAPERPQLPAGPDVKELGPAPDRKALPPAPEQPAGQASTGELSDMFDRIMGDIAGEEAGNAVTDGEKNPQNVEKILDSGILAPMPKTEVKQYWYHGSMDSTIGEFTPREVKNYNSVGTWFTSDPELAADIYGRNVYEIEEQMGNFIEGGEDFYEFFGSNIPLIRQIFGDKAADQIEAVRPNTSRARKLLLDRENGRWQNLSYQQRASLGKELKGLEESNKIARQAMNSPRYMQAWRQMMKDAGYDGVVWRNSRNDLGSIIEEGRTHDVYLVFHDKPISRKKVEAATEAGTPGQEAESDALNQETETAAAEGRQSAPMPGFDREAAINEILESARRPMPNIVESNGAFVFENASGTRVGQREKTREELIARFEQSQKNTLDEYRRRLNEMSDAEIDGRLGRIREEQKRIEDARRDAKEIGEREQRGGKKQKKGEAQTVRHPDPAIDGKPVIEKLDDGRVVVENPENASGVSVVKDRSKEERDYDSSSTQVNLPKELADKVREFGKRIPDSALADKGREDEPHITVKYGLKGSRAGEVRKILEGSGPISAKLGKVGLFTTNPDFDVVKIEVISDDLQKLHQQIADAVPNEEKFPEYNPHVTIAYVKKGEGDKYVGYRGFAGQMLTFDKVQFSGWAGNKENISVTGEKAETPATKETTLAAPTPFKLSHQRTFEEYRDAIRKTRPGMTDEQIRQQHNRVVIDAVNAGATVPTEVWDSVPYELYQGMKIRADIVPEGYQHPGEKEEAAPVEKPESVIGQTIEHRDAHINGGEVVAVSDDGAQAAVKTPTGELVTIKHPDQNQAVRKPEASVPVNTADLSSAFDKQLEDLLNEGESPAPSAPEQPAPAPRPLRSRKEASTAPKATTEKAKTPKVEKTAREPKAQEPARDMKQIAKELDLLFGDAPENVKPDSGLLESALGRMTDQQLRQSLGDPSIPTETPRATLEYLARKQMRSVEPTRPEKISRQQKPVMNFVSQAIKAMSTKELIARLKDDGARIPAGATRGEIENLARQLVEAEFNSIVPAYYEEPGEVRQFRGRLQDELRGVGPIKSPQYEEPKIVRDARQRLREAARGSRAGSGGQQIVDAAIVAGWKVYKAGISFANWSEAVIKQAGKRVEPALADAWTQIQEISDWTNLSRPISAFLLARLSAKAKAKDALALITPNEKGHSAATKAGISANDIALAKIDNILQENPEASISEVLKAISNAAPRLSIERVGSVSKDLGATSVIPTDILRFSGPAKNYREVLMRWENPPQGVEFKKEEHYGDTPNVLFDARLEDRETLEGESALFLMEGQSDWLQTAGAPIAPLKNGWIAKLAEWTINEAHSKGYAGVILPKDAEDVAILQRWGGVSETNGRWKNALGFDVTPIINRYTKDFPREFEKQLGRKLEVRSIDVGNDMIAEVYFAPIPQSPLDANYWRTRRVANLPTTVSEKLNVIEKAKSEFRPGKNAPGTLWMNHQSVITISGVAKKLGIPLEASIWGVSIEPTSVSNIADKLDEAAQDIGEQHGREFGDPIRSIAASMREAVDDANAYKQDRIVLVDSTSVSFRTMRITLREERFHRWQAAQKFRDPAIAAKIHNALINDPTYTKIRNILLDPNEFDSKIPYENKPDVLITEASAKIASGQWKDYRLESPEEGYRFLKEYFRIGARLIGPKALKEKAPGVRQAREVQEDVQREFGSTKSRRRIRGSEETGGTGGIEFAKPRVPGRNERGRPPDGEPETQGSLFGDNAESGSSQPAATAAEPAERAKPEQIQQTGIDEEKYRVAVGIFEDAYKLFADKATNPIEAMNMLLRTLRYEFGFSTDKLAAMKPYVLRFIKEKNERRTSEGQPEADRTGFDRRSTSGSEDANTGTNETGLRSNRSDKSSGREIDADRSRRIEAGARAADGHQPLPGPGGQESGQPNTESLTQSELGEIADTLTDPMGTGDTVIQAVTQNLPAVDTSTLEESQPETSAKQAQDEAGERAEAPQTRRYRLTGDSFQFDDETIEAIEEGGQMTKFRQNMDAIALMRDILTEGRRATFDEQKKLALYAGFGGIKPLFNPFDRELRLGRQDQEKWYKAQQALKAVLTPEEYKAADRSTQNAHYTSPRIVKAVWEMAERLGFRGGRILEPSMGSGNFIGMMPAELRDGTSVTGIELDLTTGQIARLLYPDANIKIQGFQDVKMPDNYYDMVISNVPFGDYRISDPAYDKYAPQIHNYFFMKSMDKVRPGGIVAFITSTGTMDSERAENVRKRLYEQADLVEAIRFPADTFKNALTSVVTDLVILRKRLPGEKAGDDAWVKSTEVALPDGQRPRLNQYLQNRMDRMLGEFNANNRMYPGRANLDRTDDFEDRLERVLQALPQNVMTSWNEAAASEWKEARKSTKAGAYSIEEGKLLRNDDGNLTPVPADDSRINRVKGMLSIRDLIHRLTNAELGRSNESPETLRANLNQAYDRFVDQYGYISLKVNRDALSGDPDLPRLLSIENYDAKAKIASKAGIFKRATVSPVLKIAKPDNIKDGVLNSLAIDGTINLPRIANDMGISVLEASMQLEDSGMAFRAPAGGWEVAAHYLSGNVRRKLAEAEVAAENDPAFQRNAEALKQIMPPFIPHTQIGVQIGAPWQSPGHIKEFIAELFNEKRDGMIAVHYDRPTGLYMVELAPTSHPRGSSLATTMWGTKDVPFHKLIEHALSGTFPKVEKEVGDGKGGTKKIIDVQATSDAQTKLETIKQRFKEWVWEDELRRKELTDRYNNLFNSYVPPQYDASFMLGEDGGGTVAGMATEWDMGEGPQKLRLRPHQMSAIYRGVLEKRGLMAHEVGLGKTLSMIATASELKRLGKVRKPAIAVPKKVLPGFVSAARAAFPYMNIHVVEGTDAETRQRTMSQIAANDWDLVLLTHDNLEQTKMYPEYEAEMLQKELDEITAIYSQMVEDNRARGVNKKSPEGRIQEQIKKRQEKLRARIEDALKSERKDNTIYFEDTGIDFLFVDEFHKFKSLPIITTMSGIKGIPTGDSERAINMLMRIRYLQGINKGSGVIAATGTPITNSMVEAYIVQKFLTPDVLEEAGIDSFDAWARSFGDVTQSLEFDATGRWKPALRLSKFKNLPELSALTRLTLDVQTAQGTGIIQKRPKRIDKVVTIPMTFSQRSFMENLRERAAAIKNNLVDASTDNYFVIGSDGNGMAADIRMVLPGMSEDPKGKIAALVNEVKRIHKAKPGTVQMIFSDVGSGSNVWGFHLYGEIIRKISKETGIPEDKIIDFSRLNNDAKVDRAVNRLRTGDALIAIGHRQNMGTGINAQDLISAIHQFDATWTPALVEQSEARGWRQGNKNKEVEIISYVVEGSFDAVKWSRVAMKQSGISSFLRGNMTSREMTEEDDDSLSYDMIAAVASGDPDYMLKAQLEQKEFKLSMMEQAHNSERTNRMREIPLLEERIVSAKQMAEQFKKVADWAQGMLDEKQDSPERHQYISPDRKTFSDKDQSAKELTFAIARAEKQQKEAKTLNSREYVGTYRGLYIYAAMTWGNKLQVTADYPMFLKRGNDTGFDISPNFENPSGTIQSFDANLRALAKNDRGRNIEEVRIPEFENSLAQLREVKESPFPYENELETVRRELAAVRGRLEAKEKEQFDKNKPLMTSSGLDVREVGPFGRSLRKKVREGDVKPEEVQGILGQMLPKIAAISRENEAGYKEYQRQKTEEYLSQMGLEDASITAIADAAIRMQKTQGHLIKGGTQNELANTPTPESADQILDRIFKIQQTGDRAREFDTEKAVKDIRATVKPGYNEPGAMLVNLAGTIVLTAAHKAAGIPSGGTGFFIGKVMHNQQALMIADALERNVQDYEQGDNLRKLAQKLREAVDDAASYGESGIVILNVDRMGFTPVNELINEERFHQRQFTLGLHNVNVTPKITALIDKDPVYQKVRRNLIEKMGYTDDSTLITTEVSAQLAAGRWQMHGLSSEQEALDFLDKYFTAAAQVVGPQAIEVDFPGTETSKGVQANVRNKLGIENKTETRSRRGSGTGQTGRDSGSETSGPAGGMERGDGSRRGSGSEAPDGGNVSTPESADSGPVGRFLKDDEGSAPIDLGLGKLFSKIPPKTTPLRQIADMLGHERVEIDVANLRDQTLDAIVEAVQKGKYGTLPGARAYYWANKLGKTSIGKNLGADTRAKKIEQRQVKFLNDALSLLTTIADNSTKMSQHQRGTRDYERAKRDMDQARVQLANALSKLGEYTHPATYAAKAYKASILSAPHIPFFNIVQQAFQFPVHEAQRAVDFMVPTKVFEKYGIKYDKAPGDIRTWGPAMERELKALRDGVATSWGDIASMLKYGVSVSELNREFADEVEKTRGRRKSGSAIGTTDKYEMGHRPRMIPGLDQVIMMVGRVQGAADVLFTNMTEATALAAAAESEARRIAKEHSYLNLTEAQIKELAADLAYEPSPALAAAAGDVAARFRLDYPTWPYEFLVRLRESERIKMGGRHVEAVWKAALDFVIPFSKIPLAGADTALFKYSPFGLVRTASRLNKAGREFKEAKRKGQAQYADPEFTEATVELYRQGLVGTAAWIALGALGTLGYIGFTGGRDDDDERRKIDNAKEILNQPYRAEMTVGDTAFDLGKMGPVGQAAAVGARTAEASKRRFDVKAGEYEPRAKQMARTIGTGLKEALTTNPVGQGLEDTSEPLFSGDLAKGAGKLAQGKLRAAVPGAVRELARVTDDKRRQSDQVDFLSRVEGDVRSGIPGLRQRLQPRINAIGEPVEESNPFSFMRNRRRDALLEDMIDLGTGPSKLRREPGESAADYNTRAIERGRQNVEAMNRLRGPETQSQSPEARRGMYDRSLNPQQLTRSSKLSEQSIDTESQIEALRADAVQQLTTMPEWASMSAPEKAKAQKLIAEELRAFRARAGGQTRRGYRRERVAVMPEWTPAELAQAAITAAKR